MPYFVFLVLKISQFLSLRGFFLRRKKQQQPESETVKPDRLVWFVTYTISPQGVRVIRRPPSPYIFQHRLPQFQRFGLLTL